MGAVTDRCVAKQSLQAGTCVNSGAATLAPDQWDGVCSAVKGILWDRGEVLWSTYIGLVSRRHTDWLRPTRWK